LRHAVPLSKLPDKSLADDGEYNRASLETIGRRKTTTTHILMSVA